MQINSVRTYGKNTFNKFQKGSFNSILNIFHRRQLLFQFPGKVTRNLISGIEDKFADKFLEEDGSLKTGGMAEKATAAYHKVEDTVVGGYKKVENASWMHSLRKWMNRNPRILRKKSDAKQRTAGTAQMYLPFSFIFKIIETQRQ